MNPWCKRHWQQVWLPNIESRKANGIIGSILMLQRVMELPEMDKAMRMAGAFHPGEPTSITGLDGKTYGNPRLMNFAMESFLGDKEAFCEVAPWSMCQDIMRQAGVPEDAIPATREE